MKSWRLRLLTAFTTVAVVLAMSIPATAEEVTVECDAEDGYCETTFTVDSQYQDVGSEPEEDVVEEEPVIEGSDEECFPFCGLEWWPY